jgi:hypothetical protein
MKQNAKFAAACVCRQGCQMVYFQTKNQNLGKFWREMENIGLFNDHLEYFTDICYNLWQFGTVCGILFPIWFVLTKKNLATLCAGMRPDGNKRERRFDPLTTIKTRLAACSAEEARGQFFKTIFAPTEEFSPS